MESIVPARHRSALAARRSFASCLPIPAYPFTEQIAFLAGRIDGDQQSKGIKIPFQDLLIGATALHLGYAVVTGNPRHFEMIPDLVVKQL